MMGAETRTQQYSERTIRQVQLDCSRAVARARFCAEQSQISRLRCVDDQPETDESFGNQLWYFEGIGVDGQLRRRGMFGVVEYSVQFGLLELVEDGVFASEAQRERFRHLYQRDTQQIGWWQPAHRWLAIGMFAVTLLFVTYLLYQFAMTA